MTERVGGESAAEVLGAGVPDAPSGGWRTATVAGVRRPIPRSVAAAAGRADRVDHLPGQHYVVRLTAEDGYTAQRSYSVASAPADPLVELFIERLDDGEVSTYLADVVEPGDELEVRGPIGGWFVWDGESPALLVAGGYGVVPFVAMLRHARDDRARWTCCGSPSPAGRWPSCPTPTSCSRPGALVVAHPRGARHPAGRPADRRRARAAVGAGPDGLRVRVGVVRRGGQPDPGRPRLAGRRHPGGAVRPQRGPCLNPLTAADDPGTRPPTG